MSRRIKVCLLILCIAASLLGCGHVVYRNEKPDDSVSQMIYDALGNDVYYLYKKEKNGVLYYEYLIRREEADVIYKFAAAANDAVSGETKKITVHLSYEIPGAREIDMVLSNYSDESLLLADYKGLKKLTVRYPNAFRNELFKNPEIYTPLEDIRSFKIDRELQDKAVDLGIDWQEIWPNLENFEIAE